MKLTNYLNYFKLNKKNKILNLQFQHYCPMEYYLCLEKIEETQDATYIKSIYECQKLFKLFKLIYQRTI